MVLIKLKYFQRLTTLPAKFPDLLTHLTALRINY